MKKTTFAVVGLGNRGAVYASHQLRFPQHMEVTAIADPRQECLDTANAYLNLPGRRLFHSAEELLEQPKLADVMLDLSADPAATGSGHNGGDTGLVWDVLQYFGQADVNTDSITTLDRSAESHYVAFAAEQSREAGGALICMDEFV